jgi:hypothetical protein
MRDRLIEGGEVKVSYPSVARVQMLLELKLEIMVGSSPILEEKYGAWISL